MRSHEITRDWPRLLLAPPAAVAGEKTTLSDVSSVGMKVRPSEARREVIDECSASRSLSSLSLVGFSPVEKRKHACEKKKKPAAGQRGRRLAAAVLHHVLLHLDLELRLRVAVWLLLEELRLELDPPAAGAGKGLSSPHTHTRGGGARGQAGPSRLRVWTTGALHGIQCARPGARG